jgi:hypothetical protein
MTHPVENAFIALGFYYCIELTVEFDLAEDEKGRVVGMRVHWPRDEHNLALAVAGVGEAFDFESCHHERYAKVIPHGNLHSNVDVCGVPTTVHFVVSQ